MGTPITIQLLAPAALPAGSAIYLHDGTTVTVDKNGLINVNASYVDELQPMGFLYANPSTGANFRNLLDGGDFTVNPWQRNIPTLASGGVLAAAITSQSPTYFADRWFGCPAGTGSVLMAQVADTSLPGFSQNCKVSRSNGNAAVVPIQFGQVVETADAIKLQGQTVTLSFWAKTGANYSGGALTVQLASGTGTNQSATLLATAGWTGETFPINTTQALTQSMQRYQFQGVVPSNATQVGVLFAFTPTGTAGADDSVSFQGLQLEIGAQASNFEHRDVQVELEICQRYSWVIAEPAAGVIVGVGGAVSAANNQIFYMAAPVQFVKAPTVTINAGSWKVAAAAAAAAATGMAAGTTHTVNAISIVSTLTETVGLAASLQGGAGTGYILASADF